jgi:phosphohistidine phosphatase SixA
MRLILVRHAKAQRPAAGEHVPEPMIPLSPDGLESARRVSSSIRAKALPGGVRILSSTKKRALETAEIIAAAFDGCAVGELAALSEDCFDYDSFVGFISRECKDALTVIAVSHAPVLADLAFAFIPRTQLPGISFSPASAACIDFDGLPEAGLGRLESRLFPE